MKVALFAGLASITALGSSGCASAPTAERPLPSTPANAITVQELMDQRIDPAADALWEAVAYVSTLHGIEDRRPRTAAEWQRVRVQALALIDATVQLERRAPRVTRAAGDIQDPIVATPETFERLAAALREAASKALAAIDARNAQRLMDAGGDIDGACEACHVVYWYPGQHRASR